MSHLPYDTWERVLVETTVTHDQTEYIVKIGSTHHDPFWLRVWHKQDAILELTISVNAFMGRKYIDDQLWNDDLLQAIHDLICRLNAMGAFF